MEKNKLNGIETKKILALRGEVRGSTFQEDIRFVREKKGEEGIRKVEEELKRINSPFDYKKIKSAGWYPIGQRVLSLLLIKKTFGWSDEEIFKMGEIAPKYAFFFKVLATIPFISAQKAIKEYGPRIWKNHYTIGEIETLEFNSKEKYFTIRLKNFKIHPILCLFITGYIQGISCFAIRSSNIKAEETRCPFKGDNFHEFKITWQ